MGTGAHTRGPSRYHFGSAAPHPAAADGSRGPPRPATLLLHTPGMALPPALLAFDAAVAWPVWMAAGVVALTSAFWFSRRDEDGEPDAESSAASPAGRSPEDAIRIRELQEAVDELTRLRAAAVEAAQRRDEFLTTIAHELRQPAERHPRLDAGARAAPRPARGRPRRAPRHPAQRAPPAAAPGRSGRHVPCGQRRAPHRAATDAHPGGARRGLPGRASRVGAQGHRSRLRRRFPGHRQRRRATPPAGAPQPALERDPLHPDRRHHLGPGDAKRQRGVDHPQRHRRGDRSRVPAARVRAVPAAAGRACRAIRRRSGWAWRWRGSSSSGTAAA